MNIETIYMFKNRVGGIQRMVEFNKFKLELPLEAQMPMIHFQSKQAGATIRASEVKPKLDKFLLGKIMEETKKTVVQLKADGTYNSIFLDPSSTINNGLDYKMQITAKYVEEIDLDDKEAKYSIFYSNMGKKPEEKLYGVFSNPLVTIICFKESLRTLIANYIEQFFLVTNFGTMQNKGFGSFVPASFGSNGILTADDEKEIATYFQKLNPGRHCYAMRFNQVPDSAIANYNAFCRKISENIKSFYSNMKSGQNFGGYSRSYIYQYMHRKLNIGNEKAWMKRQGISPNLSKPENQKKWKNQEGTFEKYYYVRALLGIGKQISYAKEYIPDTYTINAKNKVTITVKSNNFDRVESPIYFKVVRNVVFIVAFEVPETLYGAEFNFKGLKSANLKVPSKEEFASTDYKFDIQDFLDQYVKYYNDLPKKVKGINKKVVRINA